MILEIQHETAIEYADPVTEWLCELRMEPVSDAAQRCHSFRVNVGLATACIISTSSGHPRR